MKNPIILVTVILTFCLLSTESASLRQKKVGKLSREEQLAPGVHVSWEVQNETITFDVSANTTGYVGLGFASSGSMVNADIVIGGVNDSDNSTYFTDMYSAGFGRPQEDAQQDCKLLKLTQSLGITRMIFSRHLTTGDEFDAEIKNEDTYFIWAIGVTDNLSYHGGSRGSFAVNILAEARNAKNQNAQWVQVSNPKSTLISFNAPSDIFSV